MPLPNIPISVLQEKNQLATTERFIWLYEIFVPSTPTTTTYRLTKQVESISFDGQIYSPFPISHNTIVRDNTGDLPTTTLTVSNMTREVIATLENYDGLVGQRVRIILTHSLLLAGGGVVLAEEDFEVIHSSANAEAVTLQLGTMNLFDSFVPKNRMARYHCRHLYQGAACGYSLDPGSPYYLSTCDKSLYGLNGCIKHGQSYTDAGLDPIHPDRFGGFPGIPIPLTGGGI